jgi:hypothetical protein
MPEVILILFKINLVLLLFAAAYYLVLRRLTFYTVNRAFLAIGIIFSSVYPFINLTEFFNRQEQLNPNVVAMVPTIDVNALIRNHAIIDYWQIVVILFYIGVVLMAIRLIAQFVSLYRIHQRSTPGAVRNNLNVRILEGKVSPFSFWQTVYVNPAIHSANELDTILAHEQVHVKDWHTLDIILAEISVVFYWFNPGVWLMKRAIKENIEFITDAKIVKKGIDKKAYQYSLLGVGNLQASVALVNHFNLSDLKKRIKMMNAKRSSPKKLVIYVLILPVLLISTLAFTVNKKEVKSHLLPLTKALTNVDLFNAPSAKSDAVPAKIKIKRASALPISTTVKNDTIGKIQYVVRAVTLISDSSHLLPELPRVVKGVRLTTNEISYTTTDSIPRNGTVSRIENISIALRRPSVPLQSPDESSSVKEIFVMGYKSQNSAAIPGDSVRVVVGRPSYIINGKPISQEELQKVKAEDIKSVVIKAYRAPGVMIGKKIE